MARGMLLLGCDAGANENAGTRQWFSAQSALPSAAWWAEDSQIGSTVPFWGMVETKQWLSKRAPKAPSGPKRAKPRKTQSGLKLTRKCFFFGGGGPFLVNLFLLKLARISGFSCLFPAIAVFSAHFAREC